MTSRRNHLRSPRVRPRTRGQKFVVALAAGVLMLLTVAVVEYAITRPYARTLPTTEWEATQDEEVIATPLARGTLLTIDGVNHEGIDVHFDKAKLDADSLQSMQAIQMQPPVDVQEVTWRSTNPDLTGHTTIGIETTSTRPDTRIHFAMIDERSNVVLSVRAEHAVLKVTLAVAPAGKDMEKTAERKSLEWANGTQLSLAGTWPVSLEVPEGERVRLVFPSNAPQSPLTLGVEEGSVARLFVREIGVQSVQAQRYARYACASDGNAFWWGLGDPGGTACSAAPRLQAHRLTLVPDALKVQFDGTAWVAKDGKFERSDWYAWLEENPVLHKVGEALIAAFVGWVFVKVSGVWGKKK